jgi:hypothetical protein
MAKCPVGFTPTVKTSSYGDYEVKKITDGGETIYCKRRKSSSPSTSNLPEWANALNFYLDRIGFNLKPTKDSNQVILTGQKSFTGQESRWYFWKDGDYACFEGSSGDLTTAKRTNGTWIVENDEVRIDIEDGHYWTSKVNGWTKPEEEDPTPAPTEDCKPFDDKDQADKFRIWVNDNLPDIAKNIPGLDASISDKTLSKKGKCNNTHIKTAANHKIDGKTLLDIFTSGVDITKIQQEKNDRDEVYNWWEKQKTEGKVSGGKLVLFPADSRYYKNYYAYRKDDETDKNLFYFFLNDGTWFSYYKGKGYQEEGKWEIELAPELVVKESKNISLIRNLKKLINEQIIVGSKTKKHSLYKPENSSNLSVKDNQQKKDDGSKQNVVFDEKVETEKVMTPIQVESLAVLNKWSYYNNNTRFDLISQRNFGKSILETSINDGIAAISRYKPSEFCSVSASNEIKKSKKDVEDKEREKSDILTDIDKNFISKLKSLLNQVESECKKIIERRQKPSPDQNVDDKQKNDQIVKSDNLKSDSPKEMSQAQKDKINELIAAGYEKIPNCDTYDPDRLIEKINLKEKYPKLFGEDGCYVKYRELSQDSWNTFLTDASKFSALTKNIQGEKGKENCRTVISNTYDAQKNNLRTNNKFVLQGVKDFVNECHRLYRDKLGRRSDNKLEWLVYNSAAFKQLNESTNKKNMKNTLNSNIKKHLKETIEVKKTKLVENRIIKSRLELTTSNSSNINYTVKKMIQESMKMRTVGIDSNLIKENLMDLIDVLYKDKSTKVKKVFNQESAKYISEKLGLSEGAFLRRVINDAFSNNSIETTIELFNNCDYLCNIISDEVSKTLGFTDKTVEETFSRNMKSEFKSMVCPVISSIGDKMENQFNKMKSKALDKS